MKKTKIAISIDSGILAEIDRRVDGRIMRSRSQAMEVYLRKGLFESEVRIAVILLKGE
ncbi:MAG: ribbon-helix-helix protein, CopG family, partial [Nanoarchaeota archaeon]